MGFSKIQNFEMVKNMHKRYQIVDLKSVEAMVNITFPAVCIGKYVCLDVAIS